MRDWTPLSLFGFLPIMYKIFLFSVPGQFQFFQQNSIHWASQLVYYLLVHRWWVWHLSPPISSWLQHNALSKTSIFERKKMVENYLWLMRDWTPLSLFGFFLLCIKPFYFFPVAGNFQFFQQNIISRKKVFFSPILGFPN